MQALNPIPATFRQLQSFLKEGFIVSVKPEKEMLVTGKAMVTWAAAAVQGAAALLWLWPTQVEVTYNEVKQAERNSPDYDGFENDGLSVSAAAMSGTMQLQSKWNRWAALATAAGVGLQAVATALPSC